MIDIDPVETREWLEALADVKRYDGQERVDFLLKQIGATAGGALTTPYVNTIPVAEQPKYPGDLIVERKIRAIIRWNAAAMVVRANKKDLELGGHIGTYASAATLIEVGFNHFWRASNATSAGDLIFFQGHSAPGMYARSFLEGRFTEQQLDNFRQEVAGRGIGLSSYPHPWLMPEYWQFPTVSMGLGPLQAIYQARIIKYLQARNIISDKNQKVWCFCGDGEMDEPESVGALSIANREKLDNLIFVINCNLQRLDGPVRGNGKIIQELEAGSSLSEALRNHPQQFDTLYCNLCEAGESSGNIDEMLKRIATYREKTESLKRKLKKAMYYPIAVLTVACIVTVILLVKVVPTFKSMFEGFGSELPAYTKFVLNLSESIQNNGVRFLITIAFIAWLGARFYHANTSFRNLIQRSILKFPVFGKILHKAALARFARTLATTFSAGVPLPDALLLVAKASGNVVYYNAIMRTREEVSVGQRINTAMFHTHIFPNMVIQMVAIGEETGSLDGMLLKVAEIYEEEVDLAVDGLSTLLEPFIMLILGLVVGGLVIAMYLPIFKMGSVF